VSLKREKTKDIRIRSATADEKDTEDEERGGDGETKRLREGETNKQNARLA
jgi:hypothetical protein